MGLHVKCMKQYMFDEGKGRKHHEIPFTVVLVKDRQVPSVSSLSFL